MRLPSLRWWFGISGALLVLIFLTPLSAQMGDLLSGTDPGSTPGPVGVVDEPVAPDELDETGSPGWEDLPSYSGPKGRVDEYLPHEACDMCFTLPNYDEHSIYEYAESDVADGAIIISREIPNPAPEIREREDYDPEIGGYYDPETGERVWFIGTQEIVGPTDEEKWSPDLPVSTIEMKRIKARHLDEILSIEGVTSFGIGTHGFVVEVLSHYEESLDLIPDALKGIPVDARLTEGFAVLSNHQGVRLRPLPAGVSVGIGTGTAGTQ